MGAGDFRFDRQLRHSLLAIIKESLNNVLKHSGARNVVVAAKVAGSSRAFTIRDDGCGFSPGAQVGGNGLANLRAAGLFDRRANVSERHHTKVGYSIGG
jgi:signal transduction histidine kinase